MDEGYNIVSVDKPDDSVWEVVGWGIHNYNVQLAGDTQSQPLCFVLRSPNQEVAGGLIGKTYWDWLYTIPSPTMEQRKVEKPSE